MMEFSDNKPIYRQISDYAFNCIIEGKWVVGEKIPSVRELAVELGVNTRTVLKALEYLQDTNVINPRRGMGFILATDAVSKVMQERRSEFFNSSLPALLQEMNRLGITTAELLDHINNHKSS
ncbi:MAG: GntR family transcriptional regulator [Bacteroides sp.]|nr:GntR family transcriptional regulator [Bacteroides sp.]MBD5348901.1 GntR family transcriptional regulator [Bacteroides sp.]